MKLLITVNYKHSLSSSVKCVLKKHTTVFFNAYPTESLSNESLEEEVSSHAYTSHRTRHSSDFFNQRQPQVSTFILKAVCGSRVIAHFSLYTLDNRTSCSVLHVCF